jgi:hypothetical protein
MFFVVVGTSIDLILALYKSCIPNEASFNKIHESAEKSINQFEMNEKQVSNAKPADSQVLPIEKNVVYKIFASFSAYRNTANLFKITKNPNAIDCLNGIRVLSIFWVVLGHHYLLADSVAGKTSFLILKILKMFGLVIKIFSDSL